MIGHLRHALVGYDRQTDRMAYRLDLVAAQLEKAKQLADVGSDDPQAAHSYLLTWWQAKAIALLMGTSLAADEYEYFLEPFSETVQRSA